MIASYMQNGGDGFCIYNNSDIIINDLDGSDLLELELRLTFDPFNNLFSQVLIMKNESSSLENTLTDGPDSYLGFFETDPKDFTDSSYTPPTVRFASMTNDALDESLVIDEDYDSKYAVVELNFVNTYCAQGEGSDPSDYVVCADDVVTREVQKEQCDGSSEGEIDEVNKVAVRSIDLSASHINIKRLRVETDYVSGYVKIFFSYYNEAIYDSDGTTVITNPTNCEKQAVLDELSEVNPGEPVKLTLVPDPNYDAQFALDESGALILDQSGIAIISVEPVHAIKFLGTSIPSRK
jgi:hypothetical protein